MDAFILPDFLYIWQSKFMLISRLKKENNNSCHYFPFYLQLIPRNHPSFDLFAVTFIRINGGDNRAEHAVLAISNAHVSRLFIGSLVEISERTQKRMEMPLLWFIVLNLAHAVAYLKYSWKRSSSVIIRLNRRSSCWGLRSDRPYSLRAV